MRVQEWPSHNVVMLDRVSRPGLRAFRSSRIRPEHHHDLYGILPSTNVLHAVASGPSMARRCKALRQLPCDLDRMTSILPHRTCTIAHPPSLCRTHDASGTSVGNGGFPSEGSPDDRYHGSVHPVCSYRFFLKSFGGDLLPTIFDHHILDPPSDLCYCTYHLTYQTFMTSRTFCMLTLCMVGTTDLMPAAHAQEGKAPEFVIGTYPLTTPVETPEHKQEASALSGVITEVLNSNPNFKVISRNIEEVIANERATQLSADYIMGAIAKQGVADGAQQLLTGNLDRFVSNTNENKGTKSTVVGGKLNPLAGATKGATMATVSIGFTLNLVDVATGKAIATKAFAISGSAPGFAGGGENAALVNAHKAARKQITNWVVTFLHFDFSIKGVEEADKKGLPKTVLIRGGKDMALEKGEELLVKQIEMLDGLPRERLISELVVNSVEGSFSVCRVKNNSAMLKEMMDAKADIKVMFASE